MLLSVTTCCLTGFQLSSSKETYRKTWTAKYTLRSHFDGVRSLCFHPTEQALITASEDATLKLWNLQKTVPAKKLVRRLRITYTNIFVGKLMSSP